MTADPLADVLHQAEHDWRTGGQADDWQNVLARAARNYLASEIRWPSGTPGAAA